MRRSPTHFRQPALVAVLVACVSVLAPLPATAQEDAPLAQPAPVLSAGPAAPTAAAQPSAADAARAQELARLHALLEKQRAKKHSWIGPTITIVFGIATLTAGAILFTSYENSLDCDDEDEQACKSADNKFGAGLLMMPFGMAAILVGIPMLITRGVRVARIQATETAIRQLGGQISLAPSLGPRGDLGLRLHARF